MLKQALVLGFGLSLSLLAGCAATTEAPDEAEPTSALGDETHWAGGWRYYDWDFGCQTGSLKNFVVPKSRRHVYSFSASAGTETTFTLTASWPKQLGAFLMVMNAKGQLVDWTYSTTSEASLSVQLAAAGDYWLFASPVWYEKVKTAYAYTLSASCSKECSADADCGAGKTCVVPQCFKAPCKAGVCVDAPLCAEYTTSDGRYYAKNFPGSDAAAAKEWVTLDPEVSSSGVNPGTCESLNSKVCPSTDPAVCGVPIATDKEATYANLCEFQKVVRAAAGATGESKGKYWAGACPDGYCAVGWLSPPDVNSPTVYVKNFTSKGEAESWLGSSFSNLSSSEIRNGHCDDPVACITLYKPVCGVIKSEPQKTYSNSCGFQGAVMADAGSSGESKGYYTDGACKPACDYTDPKKTWMAQSAEKCALIKYFCTAPTVPFSNECGCGCQG
ncbi:MAG: hypothetical protein IPM35_35190 [Myxococcales bacterium]|nr:hypothetical protein [Myxococcales bacterium]